MKTVPPHLYVLPNIILGTSLLPQMPFYYVHQKRFSILGVMNVRLTPLQLWLTVD